LTEVDFIYLNAQKKFPLENQSFDKVIMTEVLEHLRNERFILQEISRVLKKNGKLILSVPKRRWFNVLSPITHVQHFREYDEKRIRDVLKKNDFVVEEMFVGGNIFDLIGLWIHLILKYGFGKMHLDPFFKKQVEKSFKRDFKGDGTDILVKAKKYN